jgi:hypothetical protein
LDLEGISVEGAVSITLILQAIDRIRHDFDRNIFQRLPEKFWREGERGGEVGMKVSHALARSVFVRVETSVSLVMALFEIEAAMTVSRTSTRTCWARQRQCQRRTIAGSRRRSNGGRHWLWIWQG